jgi:hypothetical protein
VLSRPQATRTFLELVSPWNRARVAPPITTGFAHHLILGQIESNYDEITDSFDAMNLKSELLRGT